MPTLTAKQQTFVNEYLIDLNATQAAIRAGYSKKSAQIIGFENLTKPMIAEAIEKGMAKRSERTEITADNVLKAIAVIGFSESEDIKPNERLKGLELLGKHLVLFSEKLIHSGGLTHEVYELTQTERSARITALLDAAATERARSTSD